MLTTIDTEGLDLVISIYDLIEYSLNYSDTTVSLWFYSKDKGTNFNDKIENTDDFKPFWYKAKWTRNTVAQTASNYSNVIQKNAAYAASLKKLSNFCRSHEIPLINWNAKSVLLVMILQMLIPITKFSLLKTQNCMSP